MNCLAAWFLLKETKGLNKEDLLILYNKKVHEKDKAFQFGAVKDIIEDNTKLDPLLKTETRFNLSNKIVRKD